MPRSVLDWMLQAGGKRNAAFSDRQSKKQKPSQQERDKLERKLWELAEEYEKDE